MMKANIMVKRIPDSEKGTYYSRIFPINPDLVSVDTLNRMKMMLNSIDEESKLYQIWKNQGKYMKQTGEKINSIDKRQSVIKNERFRVCLIQESKLRVYFSFVKNIKIKPMQKHGFMIK